MTEIIKDAGLRTFDLIVHITAPLEGELSDWPANVQDAIYAALEKKAEEVELPLAIIHSRCDIDHDAEVEGRPLEKFFLHIIASEIVMADRRTIDPRRLL